MSAGVTGATEGPLNYLTGDWARKERDPGEKA